MELKAGSRLQSTADDTEYVVVRAPAELVELTWSTTADGAAALGKRYVDEAAGLELLCVKAGSDVVICDGRDLKLKDAKPLPSSD